ncbi:hypothetical protein AZE42_09141 [Rhizopogon vesiculosus]|uniref:Uncharacterized protein n=1 Tax=Rhizopogon vesiculosus TaxID=180088 RepID=A0A1J8PFP3_9AGAM|nr:hypothetical protein AZE42_09141 [Rhizopogon vesiculosus]
MSRSQRVRDIVMLSFCAVSPTLIVLRPYPSPRRQRTWYRGRVLRSSSAWSRPFGGLPALMMWQHQLAGMPQERLEIAYNSEDLLFDTNNCDEEDEDAFYDAPDNISHDEFADNLRIPEDVRHLVFCAAYREAQDPANLNVR